MPPINKRTTHPRKNHTAAILSRKPPTVTRRTLTAENPSHSLKTAKTPSRCPHTWQRLRRLSAPLRRLSAPISAAYRSGNFWQDGRPYHETSETSGPRYSLKFLYFWPQLIVNCLFCNLRLIVYFVRDKKRLIVYCLFWQDAINC